LNAFDYQWRADGTDIGGANAVSYALTQAEVGATITLVISYTDGGGTSEGLVSAGVGPVANINDAPAGAPVISGFVAQNQTLTANTGTLNDADGLGAFSYQWQADGLDIAGADSVGYALTQAEVGATITVVVSYLDNGGTTESVTSSAVGPVSNVNDVPSGLPVINGIPTQGQTLNADTAGIDDVDGLGVFNYQWQADGLDIIAAISASLALTQTEVGSRISVIISFTDGGGVLETLDSTAVGPVINLNDAPVGLPTIDGNPTQGQALSANTGGISDADGLGTFNYQWRANNIDISGANNVNYTLTQAEVGSTITVVASYTDAGGTAESLPSAGMGPVTNSNDAPVGLPIIDGNPVTGELLVVDTTDISDDDGLGTFEYQWSADGTDIGGANTDNYTLTTLEIGSVITVLVSFTDAGGTLESLSSAGIGPVIDANQAPVAIITEPATDSVFAQGVIVSFSGTATDTEDGDIGAQLVWTSNLDGIIGNGADFALSSLSTGTHTITATVTDSGGLSPIFDPSVSITVTNGSSVDTGFTLNYEANSETVPSDGVWNELVGQTGFDFSLAANLTTAPITAYEAIGQAYQFDGSNGGITDSFQNVTGNPTNSSASFEIWMRPGDLADADVVFETGGGVDGTSIIIIDADRDSVFDDLQFTVKDSGTSVTLTADLSAVVGNVTGEFIQVVGVYERNIEGSTTDAVALYINGVLVSEDQSATALNDWAGGGDTGLARVNGGMNVGGASGFEGDIAILRFYEKALTSTAIQDNFSAITGAGGAPKVSIIAPIDGSVFAPGDTIGFTAGALDAEDGDLSLNLQWSSDLDGFLGIGAGIATILSVGDHQITASVTDSSGFVGSSAVNLSVSPVNTAPSVGILTPEDGAQFDIYDTLTFSGSASDVEDGNLGADITWISDLDGPLGNGAGVLVGLSQGLHQVTASVIDSGGLSSSSMVTLNISVGVPRVDPGYTLNYQADTEPVPSDGIWDEAGGQIAFDFALGAALTTTPISAFNGITQAYQFDANSDGGVTNSLQDITDNPSNSSASFEIWFRPSDLADFDVVFETGGGVDGTSIIITDVDADSLYDDLQFIVKDNGTMVTVTADLSAVIGNVTGEFIQVIGVYDKNYSGTNDRVQLFINGALVDERQATSLNDWAGGNNTGLARVNGNINVGGSTAFEGDIAILRFYEKALTAGEVQGNFDAVSGGTGAL